MEMAAGAQAVANQSGKVLPADYMDAILRTADRHAQLKAWEAEGRIQIVKQVSYPPYDTKTGATRWIEIRIGSKLKFDTRETEQDMGSFPSELLIAKIALALEANQDKV
jgi:hypothetical protein